MTPPVSSGRALLKLCIILCYLGQLPIFLIFLFGSTIFAIILGDDLRGLELLLYVTTLILGFGSLAIVFTEIFTLIRDSNEPRSLSLFGLQCMKTLFWIILIAGFGFLVMPSSQSDPQAERRTWSLGVTALAMTPFLVTLLFAILDGVRIDVDPSERIDVKTPLLQRRDIGV